MARQKSARFRIFPVAAALAASSAAWAQPPVLVAANAPAEVQPAVTGGQPCGKEDSPDTPARAFRTPDGAVTLITGSQNRNFRKTGSNLETLSHRCEAPVLVSRKDPSPTAYADEEWVHATYASGTDVLALLHVEYRGDKHRAESGCATGGYHACWWNTVTSAASSDGGQTFSRPPDAAKRPVVRNNFPYSPMAGNEYGFMNPSNIFAEDGYIYAFVYNRQGKNQKEGNYLIRHADNGQWSDGKWEIWRRTRWQSLEDAYQKPSKKHVIRPDVGKILNLGLTRLTKLESTFQDTTPMRAYGLVKHTESGKYVALLTSKKPHHRKDDGFYIATADCLTCTWSEPRHLVRADYRKEAVCKENPDAKEVVIYRYASLLDPASEDPNFKTVGNTPYLYTTRITYPGCKGEGGARLELVKFRVNLESFMK